jgi:N-acetylneuraminic acid mutarotase
MHSLSRLLCGFLLAQAAAAPEAAYPPMPEAFSSFGAAVADGYVYVYGGHIAKTHNYSVEAVTGKFRRLNLTKPASAWEELSPGPALQGLAMVAHNSKLYRIGGMQPKNKLGDKADVRSVASCAVYDPKSSKWSDLPPLPAPRSSHDAVTVGDRIIVVGGWDMRGSSQASQFHETTLVLDLSEKTLQWKSIPQPFRRRAFNVGVVGDKVYIVGGMNFEEEIEKTVNIFDPKNASWTTGPLLPGPKRNGFGAAVCGAADALFASPSDGKVYCLSDAKGGWTEVATLSTKRLVHRLVPVEAGNLLALGGATNDANLDSVELVQPARSETKANAKSR